MRPWPARAFVFALCWTLSACNYLGLEGGDDGGGGNGLAIPGASDAGYEATINQHFALIQLDKTDEALDVLYETNEAINPSPESTAGLRSQLSQMSSRIGSYQDHQLVLKKNVADRLVYLSYFVAFERQPMRFDFQFYKPDASWKMVAFSIDDELEEDLAEEGRAQLFD